MLFRFLFIFQLFYTISCSISCYSAQSEKNKFYYIITADNIPTELEDSSLITDSFDCSIQIIWKRNPGSTQITLFAQIIEPVSPVHKLEAEIGYETEGSVSIWEQVVIYHCYTDRCNSLSRLKSLLSSLTIYDDIADLTNLLIPVLPFQGQWCHRFSNATFEPCDITIPDDSCKRCLLLGQMDQKGAELCATCSVEEEQRSAIAYEMTFNLDNRTSFNNWMIICKQDNCNTVAIGDRIRQKSFISFDYDKFFHNRTERLQINKTFLLFIVFLMKLFQ